METVALYLALEPEGGKPVTLARVRKRTLVLDVAGEALLQAEQLAEQMAGEDEVLGELQRDEVSRLRRALERVLPELRSGGPVQ